MQKLTTYFNDFLSNIALTKKQKKALQSAHKELRKQLTSDDTVSEYVLSTFLQGSYRRSTITKPDEGKNPDVDVIVVTNIDKDRVTASQAIQLFFPFVEKYYPGRWKPQGRSIGIELDIVDLDLVITALPDEATQSAVSSTFLTEGYEIAESDPQLIEGLNWGSYLWIPDRDPDEKDWQRTHPLAQIERTIEKNKNTDGLYLGVVKTVKWWRKIHVSSENRVKSYPLEHIVWANCPDSFTCLPEGVLETISAICRNYCIEIDSSKVPFLPDHGIPEHNVLKRISFADFRTFYDTANSAIPVLRKALETDSTDQAIEIWKSLLGDEFPSTPNGTSGGGSSSGGGFSTRTKKTQLPSSGGRFAS